MECFEVSGLVVGFSVLPTRVQDARPLVGERTQRRLMTRSALSLPPIETLGPVRLRYRQARPFYKRLPWKGRRRESPVHPALLAAPLRHRGYPAVLLHVRCAAEA